MLKRILGLLAAACVALATGPTSIVDTLYFPIGASGTQQTFTGKLTIAWQNFTPADGVTLIAGSETLTITSGVLSIQLEPTDTAVPSGESYSVTWTQNGTRASYTQYCSVPTSATAIKWNRLGCTTVVPTPNITVNLSQINPAAMPAVAGTGALAVTLGAPGLVSGNPTDCVMVDGSSGACGGISSVQVEASGTSVGTRPTLNFLPGLGQLYTISDTGTAINIENGIDAATVPTFPVLQSGSPLGCASASNSTTTYTCSMSPTLTKYTVGMVLDWIPDVNGAGGATTLRVDSLAATPIKEADGTTNPSAADIVATSMRQVWYDGANFRFIALGPSSGTGGVVSSVFGRTGAVTAQMGDYAAGQVTNAAATNASNTFTAGTQDFSGAAHTKPVIVVASVGTLPATCSAGELAFVSGATAGQQIYECSATNQWTQQVVPSLSSVFGRTGAVTAQTGDYAAGQVTNAAATNASNTFTAGTQDFSGAAHTKPVIVVASVGTLPATCSAGELAFVSGATAGQQIYECSATNQWTQQVAGCGEVRLPSSTLSRTGAPAQAPM